MRPLLFISCGLWIVAATMGLFAVTVWVTVGIGFLCTVALFQGSRS